MAATSSTTLALVTESSKLVTESSKPDLSEVDRLIEKIEKNINEAGYSPMFDFKDVILDEIKIKRLVTALSHYKWHFELSLKINLTAENSNLALFKPLLKITPIAGKYNLTVKFDPIKGTCLKQIKEMIDCLANNRSILHLNLIDNEIPAWDFKAIRELLEYTKQTTRVYKMHLWETEEARKIAKSWDEDKKKAFLDLMLLKESYSYMTSFDLFPFSVTSTQCRDFFQKYQELYPVEAADKIGRWLPGCKTYLSSEDLAAIESEAHLENIAGKKEINTEFPINAFIKNKKNLKKLMKKIHSDIEAIFIIKVSLADLNKEEILELANFINQLPCSLDRLAVKNEKINEKEELEKLLLLLKHLPRLKGLDLELSYSKIEFEKLMVITQAIVNMPCLQGFQNQIYLGLEHLTNEQLLNWFDLLFSSETLLNITLHNANFPARDLAVLQKIIDTAKLKPERQISLWGDWEITKVKELKNWTREHCVAFARVMLQIEVMRSGFFISGPPFAGILEVGDTFQLVQEFANLVKDEMKGMHIKGWVEIYPFTYEQRKWLLQKISQLMPDMVFSLKNFKLEAADRLAVFLCFCGNMGRDRILDMDNAFNLINAESNAKDFIKPWSQVLNLFSGFLGEYTTTIASEDMGEVEFDTLKAVIETQLIPALTAASDKHFATSPFYIEGLNKLSHIRIREGETHDLFKWLLLLQWYTWFMSSLSVGPAEELNLSGIEKIFKEIVDFADPEMRYITGALLLETVISSPEGHSLYQKLIKAVKSKSITLIPALFLNEMILSQIFPQITASETTLERSVEPYKDPAIGILQSLTSDFGIGNKARAFVGALNTLAKNKQLRLDQKLVLIKNLMGPGDNRSKIEMDLKQYFYNLKTKYKSKPKTIAEVKTELEKILTEHLEATLTSLPPVYQKLFNEKDLKETLDFSTLDPTSFGRAITSSFTNVYHILETRRQMANWYLVQGLGLLNELHVLANIPSGQYHKASYTIIKELFRLEESQMRLYSHVFGGRRNEAALFTYLGKIRSLSGEERTALEKRYREFLCAVLSQDSQDFYINRYNPKGHPHLAKIFELRSELRSLWPQNINLDFNTFLKDQDIHFKTLSIDFVEFLKNKIFQHRHYSPDRCVILKQYLETDNEETRKEIKERLEASIKIEQEKITKLALENPTLHYFSLQLQFQLIQLAEVGIENKQGQLDGIRLVMRTLRHLPSEEFLRDLQGLQKGLESSTRKLDINKTKDWKIVFTDDFWDLFMAGTDVEGSCQRVDGDPNLNKALLSYVQDGKNKLLAIQDETGKTMTRCIVRLLLDENSNKPVLFMEEIYPYAVTSEQKQVLEKLASMLAEDFNLMLVSSESSTRSSKYPHPLVSLHGLGSEYVDAIHRIVEKGIFSIPHAQILHSPFSSYQDTLEQVLKPREDAENDTKDTIQSLSQIILEYVDIETESRSQRPLHFLWKKMDLLLEPPVEPLMDPLKIIEMKKRARPLF